MWARAPTPQSHHLSLIYESPGLPREVTFAPDRSNMLPIVRRAALTGLVIVLVVFAALTAYAQPNPSPTCSPGDGSEACDSLDSSSTTAPVTSTEGSTSQESKESPEPTTSDGEILKLEREYEKYFAQNNSITKAQWQKGLPGMREKRQMKKVRALFGDAYHECGDCSSYTLSTPCGTSMTPQ
jgi:hypothetical protein